jgi:hypothetical protein
MVKKYYSKSVDNTRKLCYTIKVIKLQIYEKEVIDMKKSYMTIQYMNISDAMLIAECRSL